ncbi:MAG: methyltransferase domain-containing protein [Candidatus Moraniibacteriota bacterium]
MKDNQWIYVANNYKLERDALSLPSLLTDEEIIHLVGERKKMRILDYGSGSGTISRLLYKNQNELIAFEPMKPMRDLMIKLTPPEKYSKISILGDIEKIKKLKNIDCILCINVLSHIKEVPVVFKMFNQISSEKGRLIVCLPHPLKNIGTWEKIKKNGVWEYIYYRLDGYIKEGKVKRTREDFYGNVVVGEVVSNHRKISTYYNWLHDAGFDVVKMLEPAPAVGLAKKYPILYSKSSRIPYFLLFECVKAKK